MFLGQSLDILSLLAQFLQFRLALDNQSRDRGVLDLGSDGVDLAANLLHEEVNLATRGLGRRTGE